MLRERDDRIDAEDSSGLPSVWRDVYRKMRCPGPPCHHEGQYCWQDPVGKKHYKLRTHHMRTLVKYVEQGGIIETHDDIPQTIRDRLYAEERQRIERQHQAPHLPESGSMFPPININVLPTQSSQPLVSSSCGTQATSSRITETKSIDIHEPFEVALEEHTDWHLSRMSTKSFKDNILKARDVVLDNCLDLKQVLSDEDPKFFLKQGVKIGAARGFVSEVLIWLEDREQKKATY